MSSKLPPGVTWRPVTDEVLKYSLSPRRPIRSYRLRPTLGVDLDGVLARQEKPERYKVAAPIRDNIAKCNKLYDAGWRIVIHTARGWPMYEVTKYWLEDNGVKYHELVMGKLAAHYYIDDRNSTFDEVLKETLGEAEAKLPCNEWIEP